MKTSDKRHCCIIYLPNGGEKTNNMTQFYYLASKVPLLEGMFGELPTLSNKGNLKFSCLEDEAGIYVEVIEQASDHLTLPYLVQIHLYIVKFGINRKDLSSLDLKCLQTLYT